MWVIQTDRAMTNPPTLRDHFVTMMIRTLKTHAIQPPSAGTERFAQCVYDLPSRCPGLRLAYETYHRFRRNRTDRPRASDMIDLARIPSVPYVDFFTTDAAMMDYCRQAAKEIGCSIRNFLEISELSCRTSASDRRTAPISQPA